MVTDVDFDKMMQQRHVELIKDISGDLNKSLVKEGKAKLKEDIFVNVFLPFFAGEENLYDVGLGNWETVASNGGLPGALYREVDVVDDEDKVLFTVPPIYDRDGIKPVKVSDRISLEGLFEQARLMGFIKPALATKNLNGVFAHLLSSMKNPNPKILEYLTRWDEIFTRYGRESFLQEKNNSSNQSSDKGDGAVYEIEEF